MKVLIIHGPNLDQLHRRDQTLYGSLSQEALFERLANEFPDISFTFYQSNYEGDVIEVLHEAQEYDGLILNLGAWTHYSYAIRDAAHMLTIPMCDVHLSNIFEREDFRKVNVLEGITKKTFMGKKEQSYIEAINYLTTLV